jgi:hypothetical protein
MACASVEREDAPETNLIFLGIVGIQVRPCFSWIMAAVNVLMCKVGWAGPCAARGTGSRAGMPAGGHPRAYGHGRQYAALRPSLTHIP